MMSHFRKSFSIFLVTLSTISCTTQQAPTRTAADVQSTAVALAWTSVIQTQIAGATPTPSLTPTPTNTPIPTATNTPLPEPISLTGSGDSIVDVTKWDHAAIMHVKYGGGGNFAITNYGKNNERFDLLVNTIGAYEGTVPIDFLDNQNTTRLEVKAAGPWQLLISPLSTAKIYNLPNTITGNGDDVILLNSKADLIKADDSQSNSNFAVWAYSQSAGRELVFNEIAPYQGTALLKPDTLILTINATGNWSLEITTK